MDEGNRLIGETRVADGNRRSPNAVISQFVQQNKTWRCRLQDFEEEPLRNSLALVVRTHAFVERLTTELERQLAP